MLKIAVFSILSIYNVFGANILYISSMATTSHQIWNEALASGLLRKGHNVTYVSPSCVKKGNYSQILFEGVYDTLTKNFDFNEASKHSSLNIISEHMRYCYYTCEASARSKGLQELLNYPAEIFDLIIFDVTGTDCLYPIIQRFKYLPTVGVTAFGLLPHVSRNFGKHLYPAHVPWYAFPYNQKMNFFERMWNFLYSYGDAIVRHPFIFDKLMRTTFGEDVPTIEEFRRHVSLILVGTNPVLHYYQPLPPNFIYVGGLHLKEAKTLPEDLQILLDGAKNGAILFSLGTIIRSDRLDENAIQELLKAFNKIPETVVWKFESEIDNLPKNVVVRKWLPQNDVLGHPNVKLFIGHGGSLSTQEAIFHGVPMICVPFIVDQFANSRNIIERKLGVALDSRNITSNEVFQKLREVLDNEIYSKNMKIASKMYKDKSKTPLETAIFWVEYVWRHKSAKFLNGPIRDLPFYVSSRLDIISLLVFVALLSVVVLYRATKIIFKLSIKYYRKAA